MIREEREVAFWVDVANHPEVSPHLYCDDNIAAIETLVLAANVLPVAAKNGGFLFVQMDGLGRTFELHTLFKPDGWGREVASAARQAFSLLFARGARLIVTQEVAGWWRSAPPKSHGWRSVGDFEPHGSLPAMKTWLLTKDAWSASPVGKKVASCL